MGEQMARSRMIKPEIWSSERINRVSLESNLLFIALLNFCDDFGLIPDSNRLILGNCFPFRESVSEKDVQKWKNELIKEGLLAKIQHENKNLIAVVKWEKHQTIMNRSKRNNIDNNKSIKEVIETIESLISVSLGSNYPIDNRQRTKDKGQKTIDSEEITPLFEDKYSFEKVWDLYGKKGNKKTSEGLWNKLPNYKKDLALEKIPLYVRSTPDAQYRKNFEGYLRKECWNDKIITNQCQADLDYKVPEHCKF